MANEKPIAYCYMCGRALYFESEICGAYGEELCPDCYDNLCQQEYERDEEMGLYEDFEWGCK